MKKNKGRDILTLDILLPIRKPYTDLIFKGIKPLEFRRKIPKNIKPGSKIYIYESKYKNGRGKVLGHVIIKKIHKINHDTKCGLELLNEFYLKIYQDTDTSENIDEAKKDWGQKIGYYDKDGNSNWKYAIEIENPTMFNFEKKIDKFRKLNGGIIKHAPQSFCYIKEVDDFLYLKTYQSNHVATILKNEDYFASMSNARFPKEYWFIKNLLKIKAHPKFECPIFCCDENLIDCECLEQSNEECLIHLKVPVSECYMMEFYDWTDVMYSLQENDGYLKVGTKMLVSEVANKMDVHSYEILQVILTRIKKEWVMEIENNSKKN